MLGRLPRHYKGWREWRSPPVPKRPKRRYLPLKSHLDKLSRAGGCPRPAPGCFAERKRISRKIVCKNISYPICLDVSAKLKLTRSHPAIFGAAKFALIQANLYRFQPVSTKLNFMLICLYQGWACHCCHCWKKRACCSLPYPL